VLWRPRANGHGNEGLVVDSRALIGSLKAQVLEARGLDEVAELSSLASRDSKLPSLGGYSFTQRFGTPFEAVEAKLNLSPLADPETNDYILPLALLLWLCLALGLYALYRMAKTQVRFAERRSDFVAAVTHELKTPLTAIRMHAEMLEQDLVGSDAKRYEYYGTITRESERLTRLIDNVLAFSQFERGTRQVQVRVGDVLPSVKESVEMLRPHVEAQGFRIELGASGPLPRVQFDPDALKQVLFNLVDNALKYGSEASDRSISVRCEAVTGGVELSVRDFGPGVERHHLRHLFEPFYRGERELTRKHSGSGIGLSLVRGLAEAMGAKVDATNAEPGFKVSLLLTS